MTYGYFSKISNNLKSNTYIKTHLGPYYLLQIVILLGEKSMSEVSFLKKDKIF